MGEYVPNRAMADKVGELWNNEPELCKEKLEQLKDIVYFILEDTGLMDVGYVLVAMRAAWAGYCLGAGLLDKKEE